METFDERAARFRALCEAELTPAGGFGTYQEKRLHAVLKNFYCPALSCQEVRLTPALCTGKYAELTDAATRRPADAPVADIRTEDGEIIEIQTGGLYPLKKKIHYYLCMTEDRVTVVHPIAAVKWLRWMDPETGEIGKARRSPRRGDVREIAKELFWLSPYLAERRFCLRVPFLEVEEVKLQNGWGNGGKRGASRFTYVPMALLDEVIFECPEDYAHAFLPDAEQLPEPFTAAEYARATGIRGRATYGMLQILSDLCFLFPAEKRGRAKTWIRKK